MELARLIAQEASDLNHSAGIQNRSVSTSLYPNISGIGAVFIADCPAAPIRSALSTDGSA
jgi:hypothetical protein